MRLNSIKLSGFKSFAELTHFHLPGQLVGVVGPNGCGKSNIMDAVRWVLGESKASELRGESMQDVIFNGSGQRKPASRASVELVFSNEDGRAGGPWARYTDIAVKRVLTRDGTSSYYINNQPVRRRDVQDVFLGTGLGPRAYAIIGQGTITRIIESRPEELRLFLEEAAGVSKYKERRRETESRLKDTRDNLTRVDDILRELRGALEKLEAQAEVAGRYRSLQAEAELKLHESWFLKHQGAAADEARAQAAVATATVALDARTAELRHAEAAQERMRQAHYAANDALHASQGVLADASLEFSRLEERIRYVVVGRQRVDARRAELQTQNTLWDERRAVASADLDAIAASLGSVGDEADALAAQAEAENERLPALEDALRKAQDASNAQRNAVVAVQQQIQVLAAESRNLADQRRQVEARRDKLVAEHTRLVAPDPARLAELQRVSADADAGRRLADATMQELADRQPAIDAARRGGQERLNAESAQRTRLGARLEALRTLQDKVQSSGKLKPWLARHGLAELPGLWRRIHVESGWETALEAALRERLGALEVSRLDSVLPLAGEPPPARLAFHTAPLPDAAHTPAPASLRSLADRLRLGEADLKTLLGDWLEGVYTAATLPDALRACDALGPGQIIMTPEGHAVGRSAVSFYAPDSEQAGLLARAQEIENLDRAFRAQVLIADEARVAQVRADAAATEAAEALTAARRDAGAAQNRAHQLQVELLRLSQQADQVGDRRSQLDAEVGELAAQHNALAERAAAGEQRFDALDRQLASAQQQHADLDDAVDVAQRALTAAREALRGLERRAQEARFTARALASRRDELLRGIDTATQQLAANAQSALQLEEEWARLADASAESGLQQALAHKLGCEQQLAARRSEYDDLTAQLRRADEQRLGFELSLEPLRERIGRLQLEAQAARLAAAQYFDQLEAAAADRGALAAGIAEHGVKLPGLQAEIDRLQREVAALGAVNLAALDELTASRERKAFLDAQSADLTEAMTTLEGAIRSIDHETRDLLASTFEQVNGHFGRMFPSLFGGGNARLVMTGEQILDAGVQVMAQPPGKKNASIHLLSGGEKALTAIALVFAIFQLNPAPFCLLDEVDAPLDDANTERYARLVKEMAKGTQFLFISHNKLAMEMAGQLIGVTMQEQGVSRIVAVDMAAAIGLAEAI